ncbi:hypothetical protein GCM10023225_25060 [Kineococcus glutinatus]|uniref:Uncharacterized protein n=1 Tax=Kineococcus glutinatus TaxID=1070872 RepID=A0ABP9I2Q5_9ACTN
MATTGSIRLVVGGLLHRRGGAAAPDRPGGGGLRGYALPAGAAPPVIVAAWAPRPPAPRKDPAP